VTGTPVQATPVKIVVDSARCTGHGRCHAVAAAVYQLDEDGFSTAGGQTVGPELREDAQRGANACPEAAISIEE
jgi:ferredoxin